MSRLNITSSRRTFLRNGLWLLAAPAIIRAGVLPSSRRIASVQTVASPPPPDEWPYSSVFNGSAYVYRTSDLAGNADSKLGTVSLWLKLTGKDDTNVNIYGCGSSKFCVQRTNSNQLLVQGETDPSGLALRMYSNSTYKASSAWIHLLASWDLSTGTKFLYINGVSDLQADPIVNDLTIDYTRTSHAIGARAGGGLVFQGELSQVYLNLAEFIDISDSANRLKFASAGHPVLLGSDGSTPTGTAPIVYINSPYTDFTTNSGTGGAFVLYLTLSPGTPP